MSRSAHFVHVVDPAPPQPDYTLTVGSTDGASQSDLTDWRQAIAEIRAPALFAAAGWLCLWSGIGLRYGTWLLIAGLGLGMLLAGLGVMLRDALAGWIEAWFAVKTESAGQGKDPGTG